jgi:hypothetical protein
MENGSRGWLSEIVVEVLDQAALQNVEVAATIPVAPTLTPVQPTFTPIPLPTLVPTAVTGGGGGGGGGNGGGDPPPPPVYTAEPP